MGMVEPTHHVFGEVRQGLLLDGRGPWTAGLGRADGDGPGGDRGPQGEAVGLQERDVTVEVRPQVRRARTWGERPRNHLVDGGF